jgi:hypothetical protein
MGGGGRGCRTGLPMYLGFLEDMTRGILCLLGEAARIVLCRLQIRTRL